MRSHARSARLRNAYARVSSPRNGQAEDGLCDGERPGARPRVNGMLEFCENEGRTKGRRVGGGATPRPEHNGDGAWGAGV